MAAEYRSAIPGNALGEATDSYSSTENAVDGGSRIVASVGPIPYIEIHGSCLHQPEVEAALRWAQTTKNLGELAVGALQLSASEVPFDPLAVGRDKRRRMQFASEVVEEALRPYGDLVVTVRSRPKSAASIARKVERRISRWNGNVEVDLTQHPLRMINDVYGIMVVIRDGFSEGDIWQILRDIQGNVHGQDHAAAHDVALDGRPALRRGGNRASAKGYVDQRLYFHIMDGDHDIPVELIMLTESGYRLYRKTHDQYCQQRDRIR